MSHKLYYAFWVVVWIFLWAGVSIPAAQMVIHKGGATPKAFLVLVALFLPLVPITVIGAGQYVIFSVLNKDSLGSWHKYMWSSLFPLVIGLMVYSLCR